MELMYSNKSNDILVNNSITGVYGDKLDLIKYGFDFEGIIYDDFWTVKRFLNGYKIKLNADILEIFSELEISYSLLKRKIKDLSKGQFKLILLVYIILNKKTVVILDYFDKGLSYKYKKRIINYLKSKYTRSLIVISNDLVFLNSLCKYLIVFKDNKIVFNDEFDNIYKSRVNIEYPPIIKFIRLANKKNAKLSYTVDNKELLKDIYRSVR